MKKTVRIYGKTINTWKSWKTIIWNGQQREKEVVTQYEIEYEEYTTDGELVAAGSEDFSADRYNEYFKCQYVWTWDGKKLNKGGHRWFEDRGLIRYSSTQRKELKQYLKNRYPKAEVIQLRTW